MKNESGISRIMMTALIEKLKKNAHFFGDMAVAETFGTHFAAADIAMRKGGNTEAYRVIVVKYAD